MAFLLRYGWDLGLNDEPGPCSRNCEEFLNSLKVVYNEMLDRDVLKNILNDHHRLTFDQFVYKAASRIKEKPGILSHIDHLTVDEFQGISTSLNFA